MLESALEVTDVKVTAKFPITLHKIWWRHQMETFSALLAICAGEFTGHRWITAQRPVTRSFEIFFHMRLNKRLRNNHEAGDLSCHRAHYDITVMSHTIPSVPYIYLNTGPAPEGLMLNLTG